MKKFILTCSLAIYLANLIVFCQDKPVNLRCEYQVNPIGIDAPQPRFFWEIMAEKRNYWQSSYQVLVASSMELLNEEKADIWNSGKVASTENIQVQYSGKALQSDSKYFWKVRSWDIKGNVSDYSEAAFWQTGIMQPEDWKAKWIYNGVDAPKDEADLYTDIANPLFRKNFTVRHKIKKASLFISGLGYFEAYLNGKKIGDHMMDPGWTNYSKKIQYLSFDVTQLLNNGENTIGVMLGNGWYNPLPLYLFNRLNLRNVLTIGQPKFISQLQIEFEDGSKQLIISDESWNTGNGPILMNSVYLGERYDARLEQEGWSNTSFKPVNWKAAALARSPGGTLVGMIQPSIRVTKLVNPVSINEPKPGVFIFDMGQNFAGVARIRLSGPAGTKVQMRYGELLNPDGNLNDKSTMVCHIMEGSYVQQRPGAPLNANQTDNYILKGKGIEEYNSRFTFHGFRYIEVTGFPGKPSLDAITGLRMNSDVESNGDFECSNPLINQIQRNCRWTFLSNIFSIESDCPGREKFGYGGDIVAASEAYIYNFNMANFYKKTVQSFQDDQKLSGGMPECAPDNTIYDEGLTADTGPIAWMIAHPWAQLKLLQYYGDRNLIKDQYVSTKKLVDFIHSCAPDLIITKGISDHESVVKKPVAVTGTAFFYHQAKMLSDFATLLNYKEDALKYDSLATAIKNAFINKFVDPLTGKVDAGTQACQAIALYYDLLPKNERAKAIEILKNNIVNERNLHLSTGIFGTKILFDVLRENDLDSLAYAINCQKTKPSYGYMIEKGATTIWESWNGGGSRNHPMFGSVSEWIFKDLGGIVPSAESVGFNKITIRPYYPSDMEWAKSSYQSVRGAVKVNWKKNAGNINLDIEIPGNTEATIMIPCSDPAKISESEKSIQENKDIENIAQDMKYCTFRTGSGNYRFSFPIPAY